MPGKSRNRTVTRRTFIKTSAATGAALAAGPVFAPAVRAQARPIRIGYVSPATGPLAPFAAADEFMLRQFHAEGLDASPENQEKIRRGTAKMDHSEHGGAPVLGVRGVVIKCHGRATARTITNAIRLTSAFIKGKLNEHIVDELRKLSVRSAWFGKWFGSKEEE